MKSYYFAKLLRPELTDKVKAFKPRSFIARSGDQTEFCYLIESGLVKVSEVTDQGHKRTLLILKKGDCMPLIWAFDHPGKVVYDYECLTEVESSTIRLSDLKAQLAEDPNLSKRCLEYFVHICWDLLERVKCLQMPYTHEKIVRLLPYLCAKVGNKVGYNVYSIPAVITQDEMAQLLGTARESISIHLKKLRNGNIIVQSTGSLTLNLNEVPDEYIHKQWFMEHEEH